MHPIITISGSPGSGKSTVAKLVEEKLGFVRLNAGDLFRAMAKEKGVTVEDLVRQAVSKPSIHSDFDEYLMKKIREMATEKPLIFEARLGGFLTKKNNIPAFRVWIDAGIGVRAMRVSERERILEDEAKRILKAREADEQAGFEKSAGADLQDESIYDMVVRTDRLRPIEVRNRIIKGFQSYVRRNQAGNDR